MLGRTFFELIPALARNLVQNERALAVREPNTITDFIYYVNIALSDVYGLSPLYAVHVSLFVQITVILLIALIGAIVLATTTLEEQKPHDD